MEKIHHFHRQLLWITIPILQQIVQRSGEKEGRNGYETPAFFEIPPKQQFFVKLLKILTLCLMLLDNAAQPPVLLAIGIDLIDELRVLEPVDVFRDQAICHGRTAQCAAHAPGKEQNQAC